MAGVQCVLQTRSLLGEGALWDAEKDLLWWLDIKGRLLHCFDPGSGANRTWPTPDDIGSLAMRERGGLVVAMGRGFFFFDPKDGSFTLVVEPEGDQPENRFNDGKPDRQGRFWAGSLHDRETRATGGLYCLDRDLSWRKLISGITASNGLAFGRDSEVLYYADSAQKCVWAFDFDADAGELRNRRIFLQLGPAEGAPDGAAIDSEGCYWLAQPDAWRVSRYDPKGRLDRVIPMPVQRPTCVAFGGRDLTTLYITTARWGLSEHALSGQDLAGGLFAIDVDVAGIADTPFGG
jgi:sugar lactone lactonase YvrE